MGFEKDDMMYGVTSLGYNLNQSSMPTTLRTIKRSTINVKVPKLHQWQKEFFKVFDSNNSAHNTKITDYYIIKSPRQCGKSFLLEMLIMRQSVNWKNSVSWFISPTLHQARKVFNDIVKMLKNIPVISKANNQLLEIYFTNGSEIHFGSAEQRETLRGNSVTGNGVLVIDEAAYISDDVFGIVFPFVNVKKRPIIMASTPLFKQGRFYELYSNSNKHYINVIHKINVNEFDLSMFISEEQKNIYRETMPTEKYVSEIEGEFMTEKSQVFGDLTNVISNSYDYDDKYYIGIDWGAGTSNDYTAISVLNSHHQQVYLKYFADLQTDETIKEVVSIINQYKPKKVLVEQNSIGKVFLDLLRNQVKSVAITPFNTTNESKSKIIQNLQVAIQNNRISLLDDSQQKVQLVTYQIESTKNGKITYNAKSGSHDDIVIALALSLEAANTKEYTIL